MAITVTQMPCNPGNYTHPRTSAITYIVLHYVGAASTARNNGAYSAFVLYTTGGTQFSTSGYIENKTTTAGTFTIDADNTGFTLNIASLLAPRYIKFCVKGAGANLTATLTPK